MLNALIIVWGLENILLATISFRKIQKSSKILDVIYPLTLINGAFVWEDILIFGTFHFLSVVIGLLLVDFRYTILLFLLFWVVRSSGEILYFFLQQFIRPKHHPHSISAHFKPIRALFGNISDQKCFILMQVLLQTVLIYALFGLTQLLLHWNQLHPIAPW